MSRDEQVLGSIRKIAAAAARSDDGKRCLVSPSPALREKLKQELRALRSSASGALAPRLRMRERTRVGFNDGTIYPGNHFALGAPAREVRKAASARKPLRGKVRVVVVLVEFSDRKFGAAFDVAHFKDLFFSTGVLPNGSVKEYFREVTGGAVDIVGEVVGPYTLPRTVTEYANGESGAGDMAPNARTMARDAAEAANADVDFGPFDNDGDGFVDAFIVLHAGEGAEVTGKATDIWSHKWVLAGGAFQADQTKIYAYLTVPEDSKIGVCCHELGHLLFGFPDLYDTDYSSEGVGDWCLMAGGSWGGGGDVPCHPSAWCKAQQGWAKIVNVKRNAKVNVSDVKTGKKIYRLWKDGGKSSEHFLVENRQRTRYDRSLPGDGLLVWHVDDSVATNENESHYRVALLQADAKRDLELGTNRGDGGDPFPGDAAKIAIDGSTTPSTRSYGGLDTSVALSAIPASAEVMTVKLVVKAPKTPLAPKAPRKRANRAPIARAEQRHKAKPSRRAVAARRRAASGGRR